MFDGCTAESLTWCLKVVQLRVYLVFDGCTAESFTWCLKVVQLRVLPGV